MDSITWQSKEYLIQWSLVYIYDQDRGLINQVLWFLLSGISTKAIEWAGIAGGLAEKQK